MVVKGRIAHTPRILIIALLVVTFVAACWVYGYRALVVVGDSMAPTYNDGDKLITLRCDADSLSKNYPVCWVRLDSGEDVIKRVVGYPGDVVQLINGDTYVNGEKIMERTTDSWDNFEFYLLDDQYLLLGDNRAVSYDARFWSPHYVSIENIRGQVPGSDLIVE